MKEKVKSKIKQLLLRLIRWVMKENIRVWEARIKKNEQALDSLSGRFALFQEVVNLSVDHHVKSSSWAVVCYKLGNKDVVKFYELNDESIKDLQPLLRAFSKANILIDTNPHIDKSLFF